MFLTTAAATLPHARPANTSGNGGPAWHSCVWRDAALSHSLLVRGEGMGRGQVRGGVGVGKWNKVQGMGGGLIDN